MVHHLRRSGRQHCGVVAGREATGQSLGVEESDFAEADEVSKTGEQEDLETRFALSGSLLLRVELLDGAELDTAESRGREPRGDADGLVQVGRFEHDVSAELFLGLGERTVGRG